MSEFDGCRTDGRGKILCDVRHLTPKRSALNVRRYAFYVRLSTMGVQRTDPRKGTTSDVKRSPVKNVKRGFRRGKEKVER